MNLEFFPHFMRANYPQIGNESNETLTELGQSFKEYLEETFKGKEDKLEPIWDISLKTVINNIGHPFKTNGYNPALIIHFDNFIKKMVEENPLDKID